MVSTLLACALSGMSAMAQSNPDVIVGDLHDIAYYGSVGGVHAFAVGTISCNVGTDHLKWIRNTNEHPVIGQNMYRFKDGRFEQIGISWLKHGFTALAGNVCSQCPPGSPSGALLGVGCSDPYSASLNGGQTSAGPRWQVNAASGEYVYPPANPSWSGSIARRLQVKDDDIKPALNAGAVYFVEGQYITRDDALAGNGWNNASYRRINLTYNSTTSVTVGMTSTTQRTKPAIYAWKELDPSVQIVRVDIPNDGVYNEAGNYRKAPGTVFVACRVTDNNDGTWTYDYAIQNVTSDRSIGGLRFNLAGGVVPSEMSFKGCAYHSGDGVPTDLSSPNTTARNYASTDWAISTSGGSIRWATESYAQNVNANAIRWGTMYNFRFKANAAPDTSGSGTIELFKPADPNSGGSPDTVQVNIVAPGAYVPRNIRVQVNPTTIADLIPPQQAVVVEADISPGDEAVQPGSAQLFYRYSNAPGTLFTGIPMTSTTGTTYAATIPGTGCGNVISFYVRAAGVSSGTATWPAAGEAGPLTRPIGTVSTAGQDDMETDRGWSAADPTDTAAATGRWVRGVPIGTSYNPGTGSVPIQPSSDHTPGAGTNCWFTGQGVGGGPAGAADVDGGKTTLTSPTIDLSRFLTARVQYWRWYFSGTLPSRNDPFVAQVSNDNGASWTTLETVQAAAGNGGWEFVDLPFPLATTAQVKIRFIAQDLGSDDTVEAAVDDLAFSTTGCSNACRVDWNADGRVTLQDWFTFLTAYLSNNGDYNNDGTNGVQDIFDFLVAYFSGGCP